MTKLRVYLVRHGETDANRQQIIQGQLDTQLNEIGQEQAQRVAERLRRASFEVAFTSDLSRAVKTAEIILLYHQHLSIVKEKDLRERFMGDLQGAEFTPGARWASITDKTAESFDAFTRRIIIWWDGRMLELAALAPKKDGEPHGILVVSHGGVIGALVRSLIRGQRISCAEGVVVHACRNTSVSIIEVGEDDQGILALYGDDSHLQLDVIGREENPDEIGIRN